MDSTPSRHRHLLIGVVAVLLISVSVPAVQASEVAVQRHAVEIELIGGWTVSAERVELEDASLTELLPTYLTGRIVYDAEFMADNTAWIGASGAVVHVAGDGRPLEVYGSPQSLSLKIKAVEIVDEESIWFGGDTGLTYFDGQNWTTHHPVTSPVTVNDIAVDDQGTVWMATSAGLAGFQNGQWMTYAADDPGTTALSESSIAVADIEFRAGKLWICSNGSIFRIDPETMVTEQIGPWSDMWSFAVDNDGEVWAGGESTVRHFSNGSWFAHPLPDDAVGTVTPVVGVDQSGSAWMAADFAGGETALFTAEGDHWVRAADGAEPLPGRLQGSHMKFDHGGTPFLVGPAGFARFDNGSWLSGIEGVEMGSYPLVATDPHGRLVAGTSVSIQRLRKGIFREVSNEVGGITDITVSANGTIWALTSSYPSQLMRIESGELATFDAPIDVDMMAAAPDGGVYLSDCFCGPGRVVHFDGVSTTVYQGPQGLVRDVVETMAVGRDGTLWTAGSRGMARFNGRTWEVFRREIEGFARLIAVDDEGHLWIATTDGLAHFDGRTVVTTELEFLEGPADTLVPGPDHVVWMLTGEPDTRRLYRIDGDRVLLYGDQLPQFSIRDIARGRAGSLWISTALGITLVPGPDYQVVRGDSLRSIAERFDTSVRRLREYNPFLDTTERSFGELIRPGDTLVMPMPGGADYVIPTTFEPLPMMVTDAQPADT